jgi:hypothetical protein
MQLPKSLDILGRQVEVIYEEDLEAWGECDSDLLTIKIRTEATTKTPEFFYQTLVHEVTHMIFRLSGIAFMENNDEEAYVRCVEALVIPWVLKHQYLLAAKS